MNALGVGWQQIVDELNRELQALDPTARASPWVDADGLLKLRAQLSPAVAAEGRALLRRYEERGLLTCELCGGPGTVHAGTLVTVTCAKCARG